MAFQLDDLKTWLAGIVREQVEQVLSEQKTPEPLLLDTEGAAQLLSLPASWVATAARRGELPSVRCGHHVRFKIADLQQFIRSCTQNSGAASTATAKRQTRKSSVAGLENGSSQQPVNSVEQ